MRGRIIPDLVESCSGCKNDSNDTTITPDVTIECDYDVASWEY